MTRDHAKKILTHLRNGKSDLMLMDALDMAISVLSTEGEYIKKEDALKALHDFWDECINFDGSGTELMLDNEGVIDDLPTYSFPDSAENKGEWIDNGNGSYTCSNCKTEWTTSQIEKMCFCPTCGNPKVKGGKAE